MLQRNLMSVHFMNGETRKMNIHIVMFLYEIHKIDFTILKRVNIMYLSLGSFMTSYLVQIILILHLMLRPLKRIILLIFIPDRMFLILLLETLIRFLYWTMLSRSFITVIFVDRITGIDELNIVQHKLINADH